MNYEFEYINNILEEQKSYFYSGNTLSLDFRIKALTKLKHLIKEFEPELLDALSSDLGKCEMEAYATEIGFVLSSISNFCHNLKKWAKPKRAIGPLTQFFSTTKIINEPYGTVLIIGPFNYPFQLLFEPLIGAIAAGNCAVLKPSENTPATSAVIEKIVNKAFDKNFVCIIQGGKDVVTALINSPFNYIFFTGSVAVGKIVMEAAAKNLVPVTLELGGKSPVIVDKTANLDVAAKRIAWGKFLNTGQTCIAPDYIFVDKSIKAQFLDKLKNAIIDFYGEHSAISPDYGRIVNEHQFTRLYNMIESDKSLLYYGGHTDKDKLYIEPTILTDVTWFSASMKEEIFGPILPVLEYDSLQEVIDDIRKRPKPLSLYLFTEDKKIEKTILNSLSFGGGCVNDTISHIAPSSLPFGGVGNSGIGAYHGKYSFETFSHKKSILKKSTWLKTDIVFPPYGNKVDIVKKLFK